MLRDLHIQNFALIDDLWLEFGPGLTVLTGETGAGKTVLLSALELIMGGRGDISSVGTGEGGAKVEALIDEAKDATILVVPGSDPGPGTRQQRAAQSADDTAGSLFNEITVSRSMSSSGRTRVLLNGELSTVAALQEQVGPLIDLHGQHDHQALLSAARHLEYLDRWASSATSGASVAMRQGGPRGGTPRESENPGVPITHALASYQSAFTAWQEARDQLVAVEAALAQGLEEAEAGRIALAEIQRVDPQVGEDDELRRRLPTLQNAGRIAESIENALGALRGEQAAIERLFEADAALESAISFDTSLSEVRAGLREATQTLEGLADMLSDYGAHIEHDPRALEEAFERIAALEGLTKRFGPTLDAVLARRDRLLSTADLNEHGSERLQEAQANAERARADLLTAAQVLIEVRRGAAADFISALSEAAADLELGPVRFDIALHELPFEQWTVRGSERAEILYAPAPATPLRPLAKIASGGEISRVMLALKSVLGAADETSILIFDEIDAGIGGATGLAIGAKLKSLAATHQVIVVTHLAQVAAYGNAHYKVSKMQVSPDTVRTLCEAVEGEERVHEIARMLSGSDSETALGHARELLARTACE